MSFTLSGYPVPNVSLSLWLHTPSPNGPATHFSHSSAHLFFFFLRRARPFLPSSSPARSVLFPGHRPHDLFLFFNQNPGTRLLKVAFSSVAQFRVSSGHHSIRSNPRDHSRPTSNSTPVPYVNCPSLAQVLLFSSQVEVPGELLFFSF